MKTYIIIFLTTLTNSVLAQTTLDTIYANEHKNVALFFPEPIRQGITGASHFVFTYNLEKEQYFGLLQAMPGTESNLLATTSNGLVYSYILKYSDKLSKHNYFINETESIGNERPKDKLVQKEKKDVDPYGKRIGYFQRASEYLLKSTNEIIATKKTKGIKLQLQKMVYEGSEVYMVIGVKNKSGIDFVIDYLNLYRTNGNKKRKASYQRLEQEVVYKHQMPNVILNGQSEECVLVFPKFVLGNNEKLQIELKERKGSRKVVLKTKN